MGMSYFTCVVGLGGAASLVDGGACVGKRARRFAQNSLGCHSVVGDVHQHYL